MTGIFFDDFRTGQTFDHAIHRTVTETDNILVTTLTHNPAALHLDAEAMKDSEFGQVLVNSCFTLSLMVGISVADTTHGTSIANLGWDDVRFQKPVYVGDTLRVETEVGKLRESRSRPNAGIVNLLHRAYNQRDELVASCTRIALVKKRSGS